jgi:hypothetical protein
MNKNTSTIIPHWISLNADETILAIILFETDTQSWLISFYDVVKLIQIVNIIEIFFLCNWIDFSSLIQHQYVHRFV